MRLFAAHPDPQSLLKALPDALIADLIRDWPLWGRDDQCPSYEERRWTRWLMLGGRGAGKTRAGAEWVRAKITGEFWAGPKAGHIALIGASIDDARRVMVEGVSGLMAVHQGFARPEFQPSRRLIAWPNGATAQIFSADDPDSLRGPQFDAAWCDELAKWRYAAEAWDMLQFGLRLGDAPQAVITTTPRPIPLLKKMMNDPALVVTRAKTDANRMHLAAAFLAEVERRYGGSKLGRQELDAEMIADDPDALFSREAIENARVTRAPELERIVVAVDPPAGHAKGASACGIVCAGLGRDGRAYVLDDMTAERKTPAQWAGIAVGLYHARGADRIVAEVNQGGAMVEAVLREVDPGVAYRAVHASRGKMIRAEPVAALYGQGRVSHVGSFAALEDEMCMGPDAGRSADRLDALVWALSDLMLRPRGPEPRIRAV